MQTQSAGESGPARLRIIRYKTVQSTNATARRLAERKASDWTIVVSRAQTKGRGRSGRRWKSPVGGLWFSIILHPNLNPRDSWMLQFFVANSVRSSIEANTGLRTSLKWPNDVVSNGAKLAGILVETKTSADRLLYAIIGIGINVNLAAKQLPRGAATIRDLLGKRFSLEDLMQHLIADLQTRYHLGLHLKSIIDDWWTNCSHRGRQVRVDSGDTIIEGVNTGIDTRGHLIVQTRNSDTVVTDGRLQVIS